MRETYDAGDVPRGIEYAGPTDVDELDRPANPLTAGDCLNPDVPDDPDDPYLGLKPRGNSFEPGPGPDANTLPQIIADIHVPPEEAEAARSDPTGGWHRLEGSDLRKVEEVAAQQGCALGKLVAGWALSQRARFGREIRARHGPLAEPNPAEAAAAKTFAEGYVRLGDALGVDLAARLPGLEECFFYSDTDAYKEAYSLMHNRPARPSSGTSSVRGGILLLRYGPPERSVKTIGHEFGHFVSLQRHFAARTDDAANGRLKPGAPFVHLSGKSTGYSPLTRRLSDNPGSLYNEFVTDLLADNAAYAAGKPLTPDNYYRAGFLPSDLLGAAIIKFTADFHIMPPNEVESLVVKGALDGDMTGVCLLSEALGEERAVAYFSLGVLNGESVDAWKAGLGEVAAQLGFAEARAAIDGIAWSVRLNPFDWKREPHKAWV